MAEFGLLEKRFKRARKKWRADKQDLALKKAFKAAKKKYENAKLSTSPQAPAKPTAIPEAQVALGLLQKQVKEARKAWKESGKTDKKLKKALRQAKRRLEAAASSEGGSEKCAVQDATPDAKKSIKRGRETQARAKPNKRQKLERENDILDNASSNGQGEEGHDNKNGDDTAVDEGNRVFVGNCNYKIDDDTILQFFKDCGEISEIYWVCNTTTGRFSGMGFVTFASNEGAAEAIKLHETECMGRRLKIRYAKPWKERPEKQPKDRVIRRPVKPLSERPDECYTVFVGNLSYSVNDESMTAFAEEKSQGTVTAIRWITDRDTDEFKGAGYMEFDSTDAVDEFVKQNGEVFMGRQLRVDFAKPKF